MIRFQCQCLNVIIPTLMDKMMSRIMVESSFSKLDDKGVFTILKVENVERKVGKETITEVNIETEEEFDGVKNFYTSRKMILAK